MTTNFFMYYIPGARNETGFLEKAVGLVGSAIQDCDLHVQNVNAGPGKNGSGALFAAIPRYLSDQYKVADVVRALKYSADPKTQTWLEGAGYWVGFVNDARPRPEDLRRQSTVGGYTYICPDTGEWVVPLARKVDGTTAFDERVVFQPDGTIKYATISRYETLCQFAAQHFEVLALLDINDPVMNVTDKHLQIAVQALAINYHVGAYELSALGTLKRSSAAYICGLLCDWPGLIAIQEARDVSKKNNGIPDTSTMNCGDEGK